MDYCKNCRYFKKFYSKENKGLCRRYPPSIYLEKEGWGFEATKSSFPSVSDVDWCGEFKPLKE